MVVFDGYDLTVFGAVVPSLLAESSWGLTPVTAGTVGSMALLGMLIGSVLAGTLADHLGRRTTVLACVAWFSVFTLLCAIAPNPAMFATFRFLVGLGLGGLIPTASTLTNEYTEPSRRPLISVIMLSGVPIGGIIAASLGIGVLPAYGWRPMFFIGATGLVLILPLCMALLPESALWLRAGGKIERAEKLEARFGITPDMNDAPEASPSHSASSFFGRIGRLLSTPFTMVTVLFAVATVGTLFAWFGLGTWLPSLMRAAGFELGSSLFFTVVLYAGAVTGSLIMGYLGTKIGSLWTGAASSLMGVIGLAILLTQTGQPSPNTGMTYVALVLAGIGTHGTQCLIIAAVSNHYPHLLRGSALGFMQGFGRIGAVMAPQIGGWLQTGTSGIGSNFIAFGLGALIACVLLLSLVRVTEKGRAADRLVAQPSN